MSKAIKEIREELDAQVTFSKKKNTSKPTHKAKDRVRYRNDAGNGFLPGDRKLF